jgi:hypothetical protein
VDGGTVVAVVAVVIVVSRVVTIADPPEVGLDD